MSLVASVLFPYVPNSPSILAVARNSTPTSLLLPYYSQMSPEKYRLSVNMTFWKSINMYNVLTKCERESWCTWGIWGMERIKSVLWGTCHIIFSVLLAMCSAEAPEKEICTVSFSVFPKSH